MTEEPMILVVDDEPAIRDMIGSALDTAGFRRIMTQPTGTAIVL